MSRTGTEFVTYALREIQVLNPIAIASGERLTDGIAAANDVLDFWRTQNLIVGGLTISTYALTNGTQDYTIGPGGTFDQTYPAAIERWSVIPDRTATYPDELPMGRPATDEEWQQVRAKTTSGPQPSVLYYDAGYDANERGTCSFYPKPNVSTCSVKLYQRVPAITSLDAATTYKLRPGMTVALTLALAVWLLDRYEKPEMPRLMAKADKALGWLKSKNIKPKPSPIRPEFVIGASAARRSFNVRTGE